jgi:hypothetical protein
MTNAEHFAQEITFSDGILAMANYSGYICYADDSQYKIMNLMGKKVVTSLFPYDPLLGNPKILLIGSTDFLVVSGTSQSKQRYLISEGATKGTKMCLDHAIGIFINFQGDPSRGTIEFSSYPKHLGTRHLTLIIVL